MATEPSLTVGLLHRLLHRNSAIQKTRTILDSMVRVFGKQLEVESTDEHLVLSVGLIDGLRHWRNENLEAAAETRHNCGHLSRRLDDFRLYEIGRHHNLIVCTIDCPAHQFNLIASFNCSVVNEVLQLCNFTL